MHLPLLLVLLFPLFHSLEVALFPSTGCYSHDVMMKQIGQEFSPNDNITWIQTFLYDFGFGEIPLPDSWKRISVWGHDEEGLELMHTAGALIWEQNVPTDFERPWDVRGSLHFVKMLERHQTFCEKLVDNQGFLDYLQSHKTDVVVLDHFLQECIGGIAHLLNASTVQFSNWPIADGYITSLNVPANPSSTPKTGTPFPGTGMNFLERVGNSVFHSLIILARYIQVYVLDNFFARKGYSTVSIIQSEAERVIYAGRSEFLFDVVRPINFRVKHFGGANCLEPSDYVVALPQERVSRGDEDADGITVGSLYSGIANDTCWSCGHVTGSRANMSHVRHRTDVYAHADQETVLQRRLALAAKFPMINFDRLDQNPFILVSFGSVAQVKNMPEAHLKGLLETFDAVPHDVVWQTNSDVAPLLKKYNLTLPENTVTLSWAPIKELLSHPNLLYIVGHGGINTINELLLLGVPLIGVPLQGDQSSNLRRMADLGSAEMVSTIRMTSGALASAMKKMESNLDKYWERASQLSSMVRFYRKLHVNDQKFWLNWTARNGEKLKNRNLLKFRYTGDEENAFWIFILAIFSVFVFVLSR